MVQIVLVGVGAGIAAALLFLSPLGGTVLAFPLFALCGLPIAIVGFAWNPLAAVIGVAAGAGLIFGFFSLPVAAVFVLLFGAPVAWLSRLAALSRQGDGGTVEWYPIGRLLLHAAGAVSVGVILIGFVVGFDPETLTREMADALAQWLAQSPSATPPPTPAELEPFARLNVSLLPVTLSAVMLFIVVFNMWLGARIAAASGRLTRPRDPLWTAVFPSEGALAFIVVLLVAFVPGPVGQAAGAIAGSLGAALALIGLATIHALTLNLSFRGPALVAVYVVLVIFGLPLILLAILGLAETFLQFRARRFGGAPPSTT